jgi:hypothetical protein
MGNFFGNFNPLDPAGILPNPLGGGGGGGGASGSSSGGGGMTIGLPSDNKDDQGPMDVQKAYGFAPAGSDSQFNAMRKSQMGMGRQG